MRGLRLIGVMLVLVLTLSAAAAAGPSKSSQPAKAPKIKIHTKGSVFCPATALVFGNVVISPNRCYVVFVLRDGRGTFLAFAPPDTKIPPGQLVRLGTPAGAKLKGRIFYLVPIRTTAAVVPMNAMTLVAFRTEDYGPSLKLVLTSTAVPNLSITFAVRF